jgi:LysM repeat protein
MKITFRHLLCISALMACNLHAQGDAATYTVKPGDSFAKIARNSGCTPAELAKANGLKLTAVIHPGQKLTLPGKGTAPAAAAADGSHTIQPGDTLAAISRRYAVSLDSLLAANPGINPKTLKPGQKIRLAAAPKPEPRQPAASPTPTTPTTPAATPAATPPAAVPPPASPPPAENADAADAQEPPQEPVAAPSEGQIRTVMVEAEMTYAEFAAKHGTDIARLNELNGLDLVSSTVLAKGSELYVPGQP